MRKVALGVVVIICTTGSAIAADMTVPTSPAPLYNWIDWYFGFYFAGSAGGGRGAGSINSAFAFAYVGTAADSGAHNGARFDVFPTPNTFIGGGQVGPDRQWGNFTGGISQDVSINASTILPKCDVAATRCGGATTQSLFQNLDYLGAIRSTSRPADDSSLSFGIDGTNSAGSFDRTRTDIRPGFAGNLWMGTLSYKFDWQ
jgi:hypothetical protein